MGDDTKDTKDGGLVSLADLSHIKLKELADDESIHQTPKTSTAPSLVFRLQPKKPSTELLGSSDTAVLDWLVAQLEQDSANSQDEQYIRDLKKDFLNLQENVAQTVFSRLIDSVTDVLPKINQETVQIEGRQEFPMLYQPTKIPMSSGNIALMKAKYEELSDKLNIELEKFNHLSASLVAEDYKNLDQLIFILKIILQLGQLDETRKIDILNKLTDNNRDKITRVELAVTNIAKLDQLSRERIIQKLQKKEQHDALKESTLDAQQNLRVNVNMQVLERLTEIEALKEFLSDIKNLDLISEPALQKTLNSGLIYFNNVILQLLNEEPTKALFDKLTVLKENIKSMVNIKKQTESLKKFIDVVDLIQDRARFQKTLQDKEKQYQQLSKETIDDKIEQLQQLLKELLSEDLETFTRIIATFDAMLKKPDLTDAQYENVNRTKENYELIHKFLNSMLASIDNLQDLKDLLLNDSSIIDDFNGAGLKVLNNKTEYTELFKKLVPIKKLVEEICSAKDEASFIDLGDELEELRKLKNYQVVTSTSEKLQTELETVRTVPKEPYKALSLSEIITQLGKLEKHYDQQQYKVLTHNIEVFLSNLQYTIDIVSKNFSTNAELMTSLPNILSKVQAIQTKLAAMHSDESQLAQKASIDFRK